MSVIYERKKWLLPHSNSAGSGEGEEWNFRVDTGGGEQRTAGHWHIQCKQYVLACRPVICAFPLTTWLITVFICRSRKVCANNFVISKILSSSLIFAEMVWTVLLPPKPPPPPKRMNTHCLTSQERGVMMKRPVLLINTSANKCHSHTSKTAAGHVQQRHRQSVCG